jgi:DNA-binding CsgD family transcriptional regulator/ligand-binding sensor protein
MEYKLPDLAHAAKLQTLTGLWDQAAGTSLSIVDPAGSILAKSGQQEICLHFCRLSPEPRQDCVRSDTGKTDKVMGGRTYMVEKCRNGLFDASTPITVRGEHIGSVVAGPFFPQAPDLGFFKRQAMQFGFEESPYIETVSRVPVVDEAKLHAFLQDFSALTEILCEAGMSKLSGEMDRSGPAEESLHLTLPVVKGVGAPLPLGQGEDDKSELEKSILSNLKELVLPYVEKLKRSGLSAEQTSTMDILESNLKEITSPVIGRIQSLGLTAREITVASLLMGGKTTKQIADLLGVSLKAVEFHRYNMRRKLGLDHKKANLGAHLLSIT